MTVQKRYDAVLATQASVVRDAWSQTPCGAAASRCMRNCYATAARGSMREVLQELELGLGAVRWLKDHEADSERCVLAGGTERPQPWQLAPHDA